MDTPGDIIRARHWHAISCTRGGSLGGAYLFNVIGPEDHLYCLVGSSAFCVRIICFDLVIKDTFKVISTMLYLKVQIVCLYAAALLIFCILAMHYGFCPLVKLTFKDLAKLTAFAAIFKTKRYFRWDIWGSLFIQFHFLSHIRFPLHIFLTFDYFR